MDFFTPENSELFFLNLSDPVNATLADAQGACTINDLDGPPLSSTGFRFFSTPFSTPEGGSGGQAWITIERTGLLAGVASVRLTTDLSTAGAADITPLVGQNIDFEDGEQFRTIAITLHDDTLDEEDEILHLRLSDPWAPGGASLEPSGYLISVTLLDDDAMPQITIGNAETTEGDEGTTTVDIPVTLSAPGGRNVWVYLCPLAAMPGPRTTTHHSPWFPPATPPA